MKRGEVISVPVDLISYSEAVNRVLLLARERTSAYVCFVNTHMVVEAHKNRRLQEAVRAATFSFSDGMPLVYYLRKKYRLVQDRIAGIDFMLDMLAVCEKEGLSVFFFGSTEHVLRCLRENMLRKFSGLKVAGMVSPPYDDIDKYNDELYVRQINSSHAYVVFVSLGCPKQEMWMAKNYNSIHAPLLGVGAAFEIHAGLKKRAPLWMQRSGLEWLFRLMQEPRRLWKRYLKTNSVFLYLFIRSYFFRK